LVDAPVHGTLVLHTTGGFTYAPERGFVGADAFTYPIVANPDGSPIPVGASLLANLMRREKEEFASKLAPTVQVVNLTAGGV
jgi:hypothetical protein